MLRSHPIQVAAAWIGNSPQVALQHYLSVTEEETLAAAADVAGEIEAKAQGTSVDLD